MIYILLLVIIALLVRMVYSTRDKGKRFNKMFSPIKGLKDFDINDPRNETHPKELVRYDYRYLTRQESVRLYKLFGPMPKIEI